MAVALKLVTTDEDWQALHAIRRATLFAPGRFDDDVVYDDNHPDDHAHGHMPFLLIEGDTPVGMVRLDVLGEIGTVRLVAIVPELQGRGHGRALEALTAAEARQNGVKRLHVNAARAAAGFYEKTGWRREIWDLSELTGIASDCVQMVKEI